MKMPRFDYDEKRHRGTLTENFGWSTGIEGHGANTELMFLDDRGHLVVRVGYRWDFGTGALDTPSMVAASLVHDVFCDLTNSGALPWSVRRKGDKLFKKMLKQYGVGWLRRGYCYRVVRLNSLMHRVSHLPRLAKHVVKNTAGIFKA